MMVSTSGVLVGVLPVVVVAVIISLVSSCSAVVAVVPLENASASNVTTFTSTAPVQYVIASNTIANCSVWATVDIILDTFPEGEVDTSANITVGLYYKLSKTITLLLETVSTKITENSTSFEFNIGACPIYNSISVGNKIGDWVLTAVFDSSLSANVTYTGNFNIAFQQAGPLQADTIYSEPIQGPPNVYNTFILPPLNSTYSGYNVEFSFSSNSTQQLNSIAISQFSDCSFTATNSLTFTVNSTTQTVATLTNIVAGFWYIQIPVAVINDADSLLLSWHITSLVVKEPHSDTFWTTRNIVILSLCGAAVLMIIVVAIAAFIWYRSKRNAYDTM